MRVLTGLAFSGNIVLWFFAALFAFMDNPELGWAIIIGFVSFLIAWKLSGGIVTSAADYFFQPEWTVFKIKLKWSNGIGVTAVLIAFIVIGVLIAYF